MAARRHPPKQLPGASPPAAPPAWTRPGSSKDREGQGRGDGGSGNWAPIGDVCGVGTSWLPS